jgi:TetR/AcrR family transcriptional repressor of nem operon
VRYDSSHKDRTKERLLKEAAAAIRADGPDRVGVAGIMAKAGLTHGGFYAHFKSKDDLIEQAIGQMFDGATRRFETTTKDLEPGAALAAYLDFYLSRSHRDAPQRGCPLPALSGDLARMPAAARKRFTAGAMQITARVAYLLRALGWAEPDRLAASAVAEMVGAVALARATADRARSNEILDASHAALMERFGLEH